ncbi:FAD-dependent oxidoreductase [Streptomyces sp. NPDC096198]|uniref:FAD-dependent oxidoreductase n=1 Tax=Streptomyces sp. NPDC096198 TaxID=3366080 RepID=UPI0038162233
MSTDAVHPDVVVAGAGPVGMVTALLLDSAGITVELVERLTEGDPHSRATVLHPRTLEALTTIRYDDGRRLTDVLLAHGRTLPRTHFAALPQLLDYSGLDTPHPYILQITQATTERVLAALVEARGIRVHRGREVTGFEQDAEGVRVHIGETVVRAGHLVGADGAWSLVRERAGISFPGVAGTVKGYLGDVELDDPPPGPTHLWDHRTGWVTVLPLFDGIHRMFGVLPEDTGLTPEEVAARRSTPSPWRICAPS